MLKFFKSILAVILVAVLSFGFAACNLPEGDSGAEKPIMHTLTLNLNEGTLKDWEAVSTFEHGKKVVLPVPERDGYTFAGWYADSELTGSSYSVINASDATADKTFWAKWEKNTGTDNPTPQTYGVTLHLNGGTFVNNSSNITSYTAGVAKKLPEAGELKYDGYTFGGWFETSDCTGNSVTEIPNTATGNKNYYAKWIKSDGGDPTPEPKTCTVTFKYGNGTGDSVVSVKSGEKVGIPTEPERTGYKFMGWYTANSGGTQYNFTQGVTADLVLYARWSPQTYKVTIDLKGGSFVNPSYNITSYTFGTEVTLPTADKLKYDGHTFGGWYNNSDCTGSAVAKIGANDLGDKDFYAKWTPTETPAELKIVAKGGYDEGAYVEVTLLEGASPSDYTFTYSGEMSGTVDDELIRISGDTVRADIVGIKAGRYSVQVTAKGNTATASDITVTSYDRSGFAHLDYENDGVGGYNNDGTPKKNAVIVYVTEETKNTVKQKLGNKNCTGIVEILQNSKNVDALIVRVIGTIGAATWKEINYDKGGDSKYNDGTDYDGNNHLPVEKVIGMNGKHLPTDHKEIFQQELIEGGYNELDVSKYSELKGLTSKANYDSGKKEYDSAWNNCSITDATNVTVEGIGTDARLFQWGFTWKNCNSIEVRNLTFEDYTEDACSFEGGTFNSKEPQALGEFNSCHLWIHHNTFLEGKNYWDVCPEQDKHEGDGATDFKRNAYVTIAYNHYFENHKTGLIGGGDAQTTANVTFHHNWYEHCNSRLPLAREANMHMYNNYYDRSTGTNMSLKAGAYAFIEYCYFDNANTPIEIKVGNNLTGAAKLYNCRFVGKQYSKNSYIYEVTDRAQRVKNQNIFNQNFDTDPAAFYYDEDNKCSYVKDLITDVNKVPEEVKKVAGVHKNA